MYKYSAHTSIRCVLAIDVIITNSNTTTSTINASRPVFIFCVNWYTSMCGPRIRAAFNRVPLRPRHSYPSKKAICSDRVAGNRWLNCGAGATEFFRFPSGGLFCFHFRVYYIFFGECRPHIYNVKKAASNTNNSNGPKIKICNANVSVRRTRK